MPYVFWWRHTVFPTCHVRLTSSTSRNVSVRIVFLSSGLSCPLSSLSWWQSCLAYHFTTPMSPAWSYKQLHSVAQQCRLFIADDAWLCVRKSHGKNRLKGLVSSLVKLFVSWTIGKPVGAPAVAAMDAWLIESKFFPRDWMTRALGMNMQKNSLLFKRHVLFACCFSFD